MSINLYKKKTINNQPVLEELLSKSTDTVADKPLVYDSTNDNVKSTNDLCVNTVTANCFCGKATCADVADVACTVCVNGVSGLHSMLTLGSDGKIYNTGDNVQAGSRCMVTPLLQTNFIFPTPDCNTIELYSGIRNDDNTGYKNLINLCYTPYRCLYDQYDCTCDSRICFENIMRGTDGPSINGMFCSDCACTYSYFTLGKNITCYHRSDPINKISSTILTSCAGHIFLDTCKWNYGENIDGQGCLCLGICSNILYSKSCLNNQYNRLIQDCTGTLICTYRGSSTYCPTTLLVGSNVINTCIANCQGCSNICQSYFSIKSNVCYGTKKGIVALDNNSFDVTVGDSSECSCFIVCRDGAVFSHTLNDTTSISRIVGSQFLGNALTATNATNADNSTCFNGCTYSEACIDIRGGLATQTCVNAVQNCADFIQSCVTAIENKIPAQASSSNQLADKAFVNSSITTNTANFRGTYACVAELPTTGNTNNDYAFICSLNTTTGNYVYDRYKWVASNSCWVCEYEINTTGFTAEQLASINSGITDNLVAKITDVYDNTVTVCMNGECKGSFNLNQNTDVCIDLGSEIGNANNASKVATASNTTNATFYPTFVDSNNGTAANESVYTDADLNYNPNTNTMNVPNVNASGKVCATGGFVGECGTTCVKIDAGNEVNYYPVAGNTMYLNYQGGVSNVIVAAGDCSANLGCVKACKFCGDLCGNAQKIDLNATNCNATYNMPLIASCCVFYSSACPITYNPATGVLTANCFDGNAKTATGTSAYNGYCLDFYQGEADRQIVISDACTSSATATVAALGRSTNCKLTFNPATGEMCRNNSSMRGYGLQLPSANGSTMYALIDANSSNYNVIEGQIYANTFSIAKTCGNEYIYRFSNDNYGCPAVGHINDTTTCFWFRYGAWISPEIFAKNPIRLVCTTTTAPSEITFCNSVSEAACAASAANATCFGGCTYAQACADFRSGLTGNTGTVTSVNVSVNGCSGTAVTTSGTVTLTNVPTCRVYKTMATANTNRNVLLGEASEAAGYGCVYVGNSCKLTFNTGTGVLTATRVNGSTAVIAGNPTVCTSTQAGSAGTIVGSGTLELYSANPFIDFHVNNACVDCSHRIIANLGNLQVIATNASGCKAATQSASFSFDSNGTFRSTSLCTECVTTGEIKASKGLFLGAECNICIYDTCGHNFICGYNHNLTIGYNSNDFVGNSNECCRITIGLDNSMCVSGNCGHSVVTGLNNRVCWNENDALSLIFGAHNCTCDGGLAVGGWNRALGECSVTLGWDSCAVDCSIAIGVGAYACANTSIAIGCSAFAMCSESIAIGCENCAQVGYGLVIGYESCASAYGTACVNSSIRKGPLREITVTWCDSTLRCDIWKAIACNIDLRKNGKGTVLTSGCTYLNAIGSTGTNVILGHICNYDYNPAVSTMWTILFSDNCGDDRMTISATCTATAASSGGDGGGFLTITGWAR